MNTQELFEQIDTLYATFKDEHAKSSKQLMVELEKLQVILKSLLLNIVKLQLLKIKNKT